jgi:DNA polymerase IV
MFIHLHIPGFHAAVHQALDSTLRGRPVAVAVDASEQAPLFDSSSEARAQRIWPGVRAAAARRRCPGLVVVTPQPELYRRAQRALVTAASAATPRVAWQQAGVDLDLHGTETLWRAVTGSDQSVAQAAWWAATLRQRVAERLALAVSVGVAPRLQLARLAALAARGTAQQVSVVMPGAEHAALVHWPLRWLRALPPELLRTLADCGLTTFGAIAELPPAALDQVLSTHAGLVRSVLDGDDALDVPALVDPERELAAVVECGGHEGGATAQRAAWLLAGLARDLGFRLRAEALAATRLTLSGTYLDGRTAERSCRPRQQLHHDDELQAAAGALLAPLARRVSWQRLTLTAGGLRPRERQEELFAPARVRRVEGARDQLRTRFGCELVTTGESVRHG